MKSYISPYPFLPLPERHRQTMSYCGIKAKIHYTSFPVASLQQVRNINDKSVTSWQLPCQRAKGKCRKADIALPRNPISELWDVTCHMGSHSVICHPTQVNAPRLTPAMQAGTRFTYPGGMKGRVDLVDLIAPRSGVEPATFRSRVQRRTAAPPIQHRGSYRETCVMDVRHYRALCSIAR